MLRERRRHANYKPNRRLDRKSSRGMIYENEELRLRTININAEVERGQSDIRKLRRENEQLRREIWSLRDEYDRLNKLLKTHKTTDGNNRESSHTEDSDSCESCKGEDIEKEIDEEEIVENEFNKRNQQAKNNQEIVENYENSQKSLERDSSIVMDGSSRSSLNSNKQRENLHVNFDHLSIVSEENLTNSDGNSVQQGDVEANFNSVQNPCGQKITDQKRNINRLSDIQSIAPPLSHFENIAYDQLGPDIASFEDNNCSTSTTTTGETIIPANGWDFNALSPYSIDSGNFVNSSTSVVILNSKATEIANSPCTIKKSPKHFFSPIKPRIRIEPSQSNSLLGNGPDVFVSNALASPYIKQNMYQSTSSLASVEPLYATVQKNESQTASPLLFQKGGNLEDLLSDIETLSNDILQMQLEKQKSYSQEKLGTNENLSNRKPFRSEMNLVLTYDGSHPVITPITKSIMSSSTTALDTTNPYAMDTPPPNLPEPMILFPQNLTYFGFEQYGKAADANQIVPQLQQNDQTSSETYPTVLPNSCSENNIVHAPSSTVNDISVQPALMKNACCKGTNEIGKSDEPETQSPASIKRKFFANRTDDTQISRSFDSKLTTTTSEKNKISRVESSTSENANCDSSSGSETVKRKSRRVSILFKKSEEKAREKYKEDKNKKLDEGISPTKKNMSGHSESAVNLSLAIAESDNPTCKKSTGSTHSTPNSPHSGGRRINSAHHSHHHHHHHHHHQQQQQQQQQSDRKMMSQDLEIKDSSHGQHQRTKSSRRHSDGTVMTSLPNTGSGSGIGLSSSAHGVHDSYHEQGTSISERNSNSLASSRESSTSLSVRSQRRKISVSSHNGGKIPWCGCWGNGCI